MIGINPSDGLAHDKKSFFLKLAKAIAIVITIISAFLFLTHMVENSRKARLASTHYARWYDQLPPEHPLKSEQNGIKTVYEFQTTITNMAGILLDTQVEIIKYKLGELNLPGLEALEAYLGKEFDKNKLEYLLVDAETSGAIKRIQLHIGETKSLKLYRNGEALSFDYVPAEELLIKGGIPELHELISSGFVKAYINDTDVAKIISNQITAIGKGHTKLVLLYGIHLLECDVIVE